MTDTTNLPITNIITVSVTDIPSGLSTPNVNALALFTTDEADNLEIFGNYYSPAQVGANYGTDSVTAQMANAIFAQTPNILSGGGVLIIAPLLSSVSATNGDFVTPNISANLAALIAVTNGDLKVTLDGGSAQNLSGLNFSNCVTLVDIAAVIEGALINCTVSANSTTITITSNKVGSSSAVVVASYAGGGTDLTVSGLLHTGTGTPTAGANSSGETLVNAIARILPQQFFAGVTTNLNMEDAVISTTAAAVQAQDMIFLHHLASTTDIAGIATTISDASETKTRLLPYVTGGQAVANLYKSAYAGRGFSQDFTGSNTSFTMHMKSLATIVPDPGITQTLLNACETAGCDPYVSIAGVPMVYSTGGNDYFDNVYTDIALKFALQTAGFNYLRQTNTKVPQTEPGMNGLKDAYTQICVQFVINGCMAPGSWTASETFGDPAIFKQNILNNGYYVYSQPVAQQNSSDRDLRKAPLVQIAIKRAGAIQSSNVIVVVND